MSAKEGTTASSCGSLNECPTCQHPDLAGSSLCCLAWAAPRTPKKLRAGVGGWSLSSLALGRIEHSRLTADIVMSATEGPAATVDVDSFTKYGYLVIRGLLDDAELSRLEQDADASAPDQRLRKQVCPSTGLHHRLPPRLATRGGTRADH